MDISHINVGDTVYVACPVGWSSWNAKIAKVSKKTPSGTITVGAWQFRKNGDITPRPQGWSNSPRLISRAEYDEIVADMARRGRINRIEACADSLTRLGGKTDAEIQALIDGLNKAWAKTTATENVDA